MKNAVINITQQFIYKHDNNPQNTIGHNHDGRRRNSLPKKRLSSSF